MSWIESHQELAQHPKTRRLARMLGISVPTAIGHLHLLWWWALDYADNGNLDRYSSEDLADAVLWEGDASTFIDAMTGCGLLDGHGFLDCDAAGRLSIHDWMEYAGKLVQQREEAKERTRKSRAAYVARTSGDVTRNAPVTYTPTVPYPTEHDMTVPKRTMSELFQPTAETDSSAPPEKKSRATKSAKPPPFPTDSDAYRETIHLREHILALDPATKVPDVDSARFWAWVREMDKLLKRRDAAEVKAAIDWCQEPGNFWATNILSASGFADHFDQIVRQMNAPPRASPNGRAKPNGGMGAWHPPEIPVTYWKEGDDDEDEAIRVPN